jgi:protein-tyrosine phosphatase
LYGRTSLDLHGLDLAECPEAVFSLTDLESLLLRHNKLQCTPESLTISISPKLAQLSMLTVLDLGYNELSVVPPQIFELRRLESLILNNNQLVTLDSRIGLLAGSLKTLHLGMNKLTSLPEEIGLLTSLNSLIAPNNELTRLPSSISKLVSLDDIFLRHNALTEFPVELFGLQRLSIISAEDNRIVSVPSPSEIPSRIQILHSVPQEVLPNIFMGSASSSKNRRALANLQLTHHIVLTDPLGEHPLECPLSDHFFQDRLLLQICDVEAQQLDDAIQQCNTFLENAVQHGHRVLVNSTLGVSRSAAIIAAYMIKNLGLTYDEALARLRTVRGSAKPNPGFEQQLRLYEKAYRS